MRVQFPSFALGETEHNSDTNTELCGLCPQTCSCGVRGSILVFQTGGTESWSVTSFIERSKLHERTNTNTKPYLWGGSSAVEHQSYKLVANRIRRVRLPLSLLEICLRSSIGRASVS